MTLENLVSELNEMYHPIFGHPELSHGARRGSETRLEKIVQVYRALADLHGRPLKVLDLGCALGYFSFNLAQLGADVTAIDSDPICVGVCREISKENPHLSVSVMQKAVENSIELLQSGDFDLVLGLSIFHHITFSSGFKNAHTIVQELIGENSVLLCELAEKSEPVYWAECLPESPLAFLEPASFVVEIDRFHNHLSSETRGLWVASNRIWVLGSRAGFFDTVTDQSHPFVGNFHRGTRKYFFGPDTIVKKYSLGSGLDEFNLREASREVEVLTTAPPAVSFPSLIFGAKMGDSFWVVESRLDGFPLLEGAGFKLEVEPKQLVQGLLDELIALEKAGFYHADIRSWNILISAEGKVRIVDFGSIHPKSEKDGSPAFAIFRFMAVALEVLRGEPFGRTLNPPLILNPDSFPEDMRSWITHVLECDANTLSFEQISNWFWVRDSLVPDHRIVHGSWHKLSEVLVESLISEHSRLLEREGEQAGSFEFDRLGARLAEIENTLSWKLTRPLRRSASVLRGVRVAFVRLARKAGD